MTKGYVVSKMLRNKNKSPLKTLAFGPRKDIKALPYDKIYNDLVCNNVHDCIKYEE